MKNAYNTTPLSFASQLALLQRNGLVVNDMEKAISFLKSISYNRLSAYFPPFQQSKDIFFPGITLEQIIDTYTFDKALRMLVFDCIESIEVAIRTQISYSMAFHYNDSHWQDKKYLFVAPYKNKIGKLTDPYSDLQAIITKATKARIPEVFITQYKEQYNFPINPPSWMCFELLTIGELSHIYRGIKSNADRKRVADYFDLHPTVFKSWMHTITYVRNICAHHSRLWNKDLAIEPDKLLKPIGKWISKPFENNKRVFYFLCLLKYLLVRSNLEHNLRDELVGLFNKYVNVPIQYLGIPSNGTGKMLAWQNEPLWN